MNRLFLLLLCTFSHPLRVYGVTHHACEFAMGVTELRIDDEALALHFTIANNTNQDMWICDSMDVGGPWSVEVCLDARGEALLVQRRLDLPMEGSGSPPTGRYVRLASGDRRNEFLSLTLPVNPRHILSGATSHDRLLVVRRVSIRIGYYSGELPSSMFRLLDQAERQPMERSEHMPVPAFGAS